MASDDLRARIAEALCPPHHRIGAVSSGQPVTALRPCQLHQAQADTVAALVQPELDGLAEVRRFCELTADSCHVPSRRTAQDILRYLDTGSWKEPAPTLGYDLPDGFRAGPGGEQ